MARYTYNQTAFSSGELSPKMYGATDNPKYKRGVKTLQNYIPTIEGPVVRRPGDKYSGVAKDYTNPPTLIPFVFTSTQSYMLEFGNQYIRFYTDNALITASSGLTQYIAQFYTEPWQGYLNSFSYITQLSTVTKLPIQNMYTLSSSTISSGSAYEVKTPYNIADVPLIRWAQMGDTLYLFHPSYPTFKLQRFSNTTWALSQANFQDGPYLPINSYANSYLSDSLNIPLTYSTASSGAANTGGVHTTGVTISSTSSSGGAILVTTSSDHNLSDGQQVFISGTSTNADNYYLTSTGPANASNPAYWLITYVSATTFILVGSTYSSAATAGAVYPGIFGLELEAYRTASGNIGIPSNGRAIALICNGNRFYGTIDGGSVQSDFYLGVISAAQANVSIANFGAGLSGQATAWYLGKYSGVMPNDPSLVSPSSTPAAGNGFPSCGTFHQNRLTLAGCPNSPDDVDLSQSGDYETFSVSPPSGSTALQIQDNNAISETLLASDTNPILWVKSTAHGLVTGTYTSQFLITPDTNAAALTPSNFNSYRMAYFGCSQIDAVTIDNAVIYVQRSERKVRELLYNFFIGTFKPTDLTDGSDHITLPSVTKIAIQEQRQPIMWAIRSDGALLSMTYVRTDTPGFGTTAVESGWARHTLGGQSDAAGSPPIVLSIGVISDPTNTFDQLWMVVKRWINGATVCTIECLTDIFSDDILQEDAFQGDCGYTYYSPKVISGVSTGTTTTITATSHGFSNGDTVRVVNVIGVNENGESVLNEEIFTVASATSSTFEITDSEGNAINTSSASAYISGGDVSKLVSTISGLTWLENETISLFLDGAPGGTVTVSNSGSITLPYPAAKVQIGYAFTSQMELLRIEGGAQNGSSFGDLRRTNKFAVQCHRMGLLQVGTSFDDLRGCEFRQADSQEYDQATPLFSGIYVDPVTSDYDYDSTLCFEQTDMSPGMIQSITTVQEVNEK